MFPDFLCIGAQKAGTTWLHENLAQHPQIWLPPVKEIHFLDHRPPTLKQILFGGKAYHRTARENAVSTVRRALTSGAGLDEVARALRIAYAPRNWTWYERIFPEDPDRICGEICPGYARLPLSTIEAVARRNPRIKVIYLLRDPIDRAWSSLAMHFRKEPGEMISAFPATDLEERLSNPKTFSHCEYDKNIERWLSHIPREQIHFGFFERMKEDPVGHLTEILGFLGVTAADATFLAAADPVNAGKGERIDPEFEGRLGRLLKPEAAALHRRFRNAYTERWLAHAETAAAAA